MWTYADLVGLLATVLAIAVGLGGAPAVVQWLKQVLNLQGNWAVALSVAVALLFGIVALMVEGVIAPETFTPANAVGLVLAVWTASQIQYHLIGRVVGSEDGDG